MFYDRFTDRARKVMAYARQEAQRFNHDYIGTEHILLGLIKEGSGVAANVLRSLDLDVKDVRARIEKLVKPDDALVSKGNMPFTPRAKKVIEYSMEEARALGHNYIGTEHLLLGLLREEDGIAATVLLEVGAKLDVVRAETLRMLGKKKEEEAETQGPPPDDPAKRKELVRFWRQFSILISSGVPILSVLDVQKVESPLPELRDAITFVHESIRSGSSMFAPLAQFPALFSAGVLALVRAGEAGGVLHTIAERIANGLESGALAVSGKPGELPPSVIAEPSGPGIDRKKEEESVVKRVNALLRDAALSRASDIHFEPTEEGGRVRVRIDGALQVRESLDRSTYEAMVSRLMIMADLDIAEKRRPQDGRILLEVDGKKLDLRVSFCPYVHGYSVVARILDKEAVQLKVADLGVSEADLATLKEWTRRPNGIHIVSGPTGSGKTTMLYALISEVNRPECKVISIESPVEYILDGVNQAEVRPGLGVTFAALVRAALRQDPDVFLIGEVRDQDTAMLLPAVSMTGHLVFTTLHTENATEIPARLVDIGLAPWLVKTCLDGALGMRLVRMVCKACAGPYQPDSLEGLAGLSDESELRKGQFMRGRGCDKCHNTGFRRRTGIYEILPMTPKIKEMIGDKASAKELRQAAIAEGMVTMRHDGLRKAARGMTTVEEVLRVTYGMM